jgi:Helix-turn-helix domain
MQKPAKRGSYLPPREQLEMRLRQANGDSMRKIAREMDRDWTTVARVLKSEEAQAEVERLRCGLIGLGDALIQSLYRAVVAENDGRMAFQLGERIGFIPPLPQKNEVTKMNGEQLIDAYRTRALMQLANVAIERHRIYGSTPPMEREEFEELVGKPPEGQEPLIRDVVQKEEYDPLVFPPDEEGDKPEQK